MTRDNAIAVAIKTCIDEDILKEFLTEHYAEVLKMLNWEYDAEAEKRVLKQEGYQIGLERGHQQGLLQGHQQGLQQGTALMARLLQEGMSYEDALKRITEQGLVTPPQ